MDMGLREVRVGRDMIWLETVKFGGLAIMLLERRSEAWRLGKRRGEEGSCVLA